MNAQGHINTLGGHLIPGVVTLDGADYHASRDYKNRGVFLVPLADQQTYAVVRFQVATKALECQPLSAVEVEAVKAALPEAAWYKISYKMQAGRVVPMGGGAERDDLIREASDVSRPERGIG
jgi:hypothetical protein